MPSGIDWKLIVSIGSLGVGVAGFLLGIFNWRKAKKELSYETSVTRISGFDDQFSGQLRLTFAGTPVVDVSFAKITFRNSGRRPIEAKDFDTDLSIRFDCEELLWFGYDKDDPTTLKPVISQGSEDKTLIIKRLLLNRGDEIRFSTLIRGSRKIQPEARISEIKGIKEKQKSSQIDMRTLAIPATMSLLALVVLFLVVTQVTTVRHQEEVARELQERLEMQVQHDRQGLDDLTRQLIRQKPANPLLKTAP